MDRVHVYIEGVFTQKAKGIFCRAQVPTKTTQICEQMNICICRVTGRNRFFPRDILGALEEKAMGRAGHAGGINTWSAELFFPVRGELSFFFFFETSGIKEWIYLNPHFSTSCKLLK